MLFFPPVVSSVLTFLLFPPFISLLFGSVFLLSASCCVIVWALPVYSIKLEDPTKSTRYYSECLQVYRKAGLGFFPSQNHEPQ